MGLLELDEGLSDFMDIAMKRLAALKSSLPNCSPTYWISKKKTKNTIDSLIPILCPRSVESTLLGQRAFLFYQILHIKKNSIGGLKY